MTGPVDRITEVLREHRWVSYDMSRDACGGCDWRGMNRDEHWAHVAEVVVQALGLKSEFGIKGDKDEHPFSASSWDAAEAQKAADYNSARWGQYHVESRWVSPWVGLQP